MISERSEREVFRVIPVFNALVKYSRGSVPEPIVWVILSMVAWFSMALIEGIFIKTYPSPANDLTGFIMMITCVALGLISIFGRDKE